MKKPIAFRILFSLSMLIAVAAAAADEATASPRQAAESTADAPSFFAMGFTPSASLSLGRLPSLTLGGTLRFAWRPLPELSLDAAASARRLVGHDFALTVSGLWSPLRSGVWSLGCGASLGLSYESRLVGYNQDDPPPEGGVYGPYWAVTAGVVIAPLQLRLARIDLSFLRLSGGVLFGAWLVAPVFTIDLVELAVHL